MNAVSTMRVRSTLPLSHGQSTRRNNQSGSSLLPDVGGRGEHPLSIQEGFASC